MNPVIDRPSGHDGDRPDRARYEQVYRDVARERELVLVDHGPAWAALLAQGAEGYAQFMLPALRAALAPSTAP